MSSGKTTQGAKDNYGHCAGIICCGDLDFIWGLMVNNEVVWPKAKEWDSHIHQKNKIVIYTDGNVYQTLEKTDIDPPASPWMLLAIPWAAGTTHTDEFKLSNGHVWKAVADTTTMPPADPPDPIVHGNTLVKIEVQSDTPIGDWLYIATPQLFSAATHFWEANSIVAHNGRLWINSADTNEEPGADPVWSLWKQDLTGGPNPFKFTVEGMGDVYQYLGTADQVLDTADEQILNALGHPPYRHRAVTMLKNFLFGSSTTTPPNVKVLGGRRPKQSLIMDNSGVVGVDATAFDDDWQVNPWCVLAELLTHPVIGLGLPLSWFDADSWQAEADRCAANPQFYYVSPIYTSLMKVRELVADLLGYPDAFIFWSSVATLIAGHWPHHEAAPAFTNDTTIDRNDLIEEIPSDSEGWGGTANSVEVSFNDIEANFTSRPALAPNLFNRTITRRLTILRLERPHIVRFKQALAWATEAAKIAGDQTFNCVELVIRAEKAATLQPGGLFLLTDDALAISWVMRCSKKTIAAAGIGQVKISCELERGVAPQPFTPTPTNPTPAQGPPPTTILNYAAVQLPAALSGKANTLGVLACRENDVTGSVEVWLKAADTTAFQALGTNKGFAVAGTFIVNANDEVIEGSPATSNTIFADAGQVTQGNTYDLGQTDFWKHQVFYSVNSSLIPHFTATEGIDYTIDPSTGMLTILAGGNIPTNDYVQVKLWLTLAVFFNPNTPQSDLDNIRSVPTQDEINDGKILLFAFKADNPALFEIMSIRSVQSLGLDPVHGKPVMYIQVLRTQFGTLYGGDGSYVWGTNSNDVIMMIRKEDILPLSHVNFPFYHDDQSTVQLRLSPASTWQQADVEDLYDPASNPGGLTTAFNYSFDNIYAPVATWGQLLNNDVAITDFTTNFAAADVFSFSFELVDRNGDLVNGALVAIQGQQEITLWSTNMSPAGVYDKTVQFSLPKGNWKIELRAWDASGNQSSTPLTYSGDLVTIYVDNGTAAAPIIYPPSDNHNHNGYRTDLLFGLLPGVADDFQVYYQLQDRDVALDSGAWITCQVSGAAISGLYLWGDSTYGTLPPVKKGTNGKTLYAYCTQTSKSDSDVVKWNF